MKDNKSNKGHDAVGNWILALMITKKKTRNDKWSV